MVRLPILEDIVLNQTDSNKVFVDPIIYIDIYIALIDVGQNGL